MEPLRDGPAVLRAQGERLQDEEVEGALREIESLVGHGCPLALLQER
jgi:hypothetical protein